MAEIRTGGAEDLESIANLWNVVWPHHFRGLDELRRELELPMVECRPEFLLAEADGKLVGTAEFNRDMGSYHPQKWSIAVNVLPEARRHGVGGELSDRMMELLIERGAISAITRVSDEDSDSIRFTEKRGFQEVKRDFESELDITCLPPGVLNSVVDCPASIVPISEMDTPEFRRNFHEAFEEIRIDTPRTEPPTRLEFDHFQEILFDEPDFLPEESRVAIVDGKIAGFTGFYKMEQEGGLFQWLTGVRREFRRLKIAKAMKIDALRGAVAKGYRTIRTDNDTRNAPMLAINDQLGFTRLPGMITYRLILDAE